MDRDKAVAKILIDETNICKLLDNHKEIPAQLMYDLYHEVVLMLSCPDCKKYYEICEEVEIGGQKFYSFIHRND